MKYTAKWDSMFGMVEIHERPPGSESVNKIFSDTARSAAEASDMVKEQGFGFKDMWTSKTGGATFTAPLVPMDPQGDRPEFPDR